MHLDESPGDREPQPGSAARAAARPLHAVEAVEHPRQLLATDAGTVVGDRDRDRGLRGPPARVIVPPVGGVGHRVAHEVQQRLHELVGLAGDPQVRPRFDAYRPPPEPAAARRRLLEQGRDVERLVDARRRRLEAREREQVVHETAHARHLVGDEREFLVALGRVHVQVTHHLDVPGDHRERRAQLVRGVGGEAALLAERALQPVEHRVDRVDHAADLVVRAVVGDALGE